jgi:hypothetical protein
MSLFNKVSKALDKYNDEKDYTYDFEDIRNNIKLTFEHLKIEIEEHNEREKQIPWFLTVVGFLIAYAPKLITFICSCKSSKLDVVPFVLYAISLLATVVCFIEFMLPRKRLQLNKPKDFYKNIADSYKADENIPDKMINLYVQHSYLDHLEDCLSAFQRSNRLKSDWRYYTYISILMTSLFYIISITIQLIKTTSYV